MNKNDMGIFLLCLFVFIALILVSGFICFKIYKSYVKAVKSGKEDSEIEALYLKQQKKKKPTKKRILISNIFDLILDTVLILLIGVIIYFNFTGNGKIGNIPQLKTVESSSMAVKNDVNKYLFENHLDNQFTITDLIVLDKMPEEKDIKVYDVILYRRMDGLLVLHRVIDIIHTDKGYTFYRFQGDAVPIPDESMVKYEDMLGIYHGVKIPFFGGTVRFLKSPAGYLCLGLFVLLLLIYPIIDKKLLALENERLIKMGYEIPEDSKKKKKNKNTIKTKGEK